VSCDEVVVCSIQLASWYSQVGEALIKQYTDMGVNLNTAQDYVDTHQALATDVKVLTLHWRLSSIFCSSSSSSSTSSSIVAAAVAAAAAAVVAVAVVVL